MVEPKELNYLVQRCVLCWICVFVLMYFVQMNVQFVRLFSILVQ